MKKTLIAILSNHNNEEHLIELKNLLDNVATKHKNSFQDFGFVFTYKTFRLLIKKPKAKLDKDEKMEFKVKKETREFLMDRSIYLPPYEKVGNIILSFMITQKQISVIWHFIHPLTAYVSTPGNNSLMRLCDIWNVKRFLHSQAVEYWIKEEANIDQKRNRQPFPPSLLLRRSSDDAEKYKISTVPGECKFPCFELPNNLHKRGKNDPWTLCLVVDDSVKDRFIRLSMSYEHELDLFQKILTTNKTGKALEDNVPSLKSKLYRYHSGPRGGTLEIALEIIFGKCDALFVYSDPLVVQSNSDDVKVLIGAAGLNKRVRLFTNESHFIEWLEHFVREKIEFV